MKAHLFEDQNSGSAKALKRLLLMSGLAAFVMFLPFIIADGGRFSLISDFNHQQIPFNMHSAWALKNGQAQWDWYTDLGVNFIGAFSFYTLGSPFFWLSMLFPEGSFPWMAGWLYMLKYMAAALCAFLWLKRHVKDPDFAALGAMLYAFSGFSHINLMYYHFHEVLAFFPLLLLSLDLLVLEGRRGLFALMTAVSALINYFFFFGEVLFLILYFLLVYHFPDRKTGLKKFLQVLGEGIIGVLAASALLLPSALFILQSPKTADRLEGMELLWYRKGRYLTLLKALLFPAEAMAHQSGFLSYDFSSAALYLPAFGLSMVLAGFKESRWKLLILALISIALIPGLNSLFTLMNHTYYARWFFMPVLVLSAVSIQALEKTSFEEKARWMKITLTVTLAFIILSFVLPSLKKETLYRPELFLFSGFLALTGLRGTWFIVKRGGKKEMSQLLIWVTIISSLTGIFSVTLIRGQIQGEPQTFASGYLFETAAMELGPSPSENQENYRTASPVQGWNLSMVNRIPSANSFITTVSPSAHEFYDLVGITHLAASVFPEEKNDILTLLSVRYRMDLHSQRQWKRLYSKSNGKDRIHVSENPNFIPLGFPQDHYIHRTDLMAYAQEDRARVLLKARLLEDGEIPPDYLEAYTSRDFQEPIKETADDRRRRALTDFSRDTRSFQGNVQSNTETSLLFTVPWDPGWTAELNGEPVAIVKNAGFMAIHIPEGRHRVEFFYRIPGLGAGIFLSVTASAFLLLILLKDTKKPERKGRKAGRRSP